MISKTIRSIAMAMLGVVVTGCATVNPMAFDKKSASIDTKEKSVILMTIDVSRSDGSRFVPEPFVVKLEKPQAQGKEDRQNFKMSKGDDSLPQDGHTLYLARLALVAGEYRLADVTGSASAFPITSMFVVPLNLNLKVKPGSVTYVGRITAKLRERVGDEFRAGPVVPLIDQAVSGMSGGTWDVSVDNLAEKDIALFRNTYPVLNNVTIDTAPLPAYDRAAVQRWWNGQPDEPQQAGAPAKAQEPAKAPEQVAAR